MSVIKKLSLVLVAILAVVFAANSAMGAKDEAERLWELGEKALEAGKYKEALSCYNRSLALCGGNLECVASNMNSIGVVYEAQDDDKKALTYYEQALAAARKINNRDLIATNLFNTGAVYYRTFNQYDRALSRMQESEKIFRQLGDTKSLAIVLFNIGKVYNATGKYDRALPLFNESLRMNRQMNNQQGIAVNLNLIGDAYAGLGQHDKPLPYYQQALAILRKMDNQIELATTLRNIGDAYCNLKERDRALPYYNEALEILKRANSSFDLAVMYGNLGVLYKEQDQYDKALSFYEQSLKLARKIDNSALVATCLSNIGNVYASLGKSGEALSYYRQALDLENRLDRPQKRALVLNNIGMEYFRIGRYGDALSYLNDALRLDRQINNPHNIAIRLNNIGAVYLRQKRYGEAERVFLERKELGRRIAKTRLIHAGLIEVYIETKRYDAALALLRELPPNWRDSRNRRLEYHTEYGMALKGKGDLNGAAGEFIKAVSIIEEIRREAGDRGSFFAGGGYINRVKPYNELMAVFAEMSLRGYRAGDSFRKYGSDPAAAAFYFAEMTKARTLLEMMAGAARKYDDPQIPATVRNREANIIRELASIESDWDSSFARGEAAVRKLSERKQRLARELDELVAGLRKSHPLYAAINYPLPILAGDLPLRDNEALLEFGIANDAVFAFVVRKGGAVKVFRQAITRDELTDKVTAFLGPLKSPERRNEFSLRLAGELHGLLLAGPLKGLNVADRLIIIPDGILALLPFEALVGPGGDFAGDRQVITYNQSATALALGRLARASTAHRTLFAVGNPVYDRSDPRYIAFKQGGRPAAQTGDPARYAYRGLSVIPKQGSAADAVSWENVIFPPLPETEDEIRAIARLFRVRPEPPDILLGVYASETSLRKAPLGDYRYLHFATHADMPGKVQGINEPFIILGQVENRGGDNGFLTLSEVLGLKLNAELVVLSACSTGQGSLMEGEGVASFARAFQHAGSRSVVVSLWEVASNAAVEFMTSFYGHIKAGRSEAEALRSARREIKAKYPSPFFWSVFVLYGQG
jgi:CHAT domain-containing protein/predicted negative regulator of RcsB-dependent stress response